MATVDDVRALLPEKAARLVHHLGRTKHASRLEAFSENGELLARINLTPHGLALGSVFLS